MASMAFPYAITEYGVSRRRLHGPRASSCWVDGSAWPAPPLSSSGSSGSSRTSWLQHPPIRAEPPRTPCLGLPAGHGPVTRFRWRIADCCGRTVNLDLRGVPTSPRFPSSRGRPGGRHRFPHMPDHHVCWGHPGLRIRLLSLLGMHIHVLGSVLRRICGMICRNG
jgi:hypothetical protein